MEDSTGVIEGLITSEERDCADAVGDADGDCAKEEGRYENRELTLALACGSGKNGDAVIGAVDGIFCDNCTIVGEDKSGSAVAGSIFWLGGLGELWKGLLSSVSVLDSSSPPSSFSLSFFLLSSFSRSSLSL
ncbi:hypothetical protein FACS1894152_0110 [Bacilli bacterium]|nr:hypothetical protein FACS1894152_0110 [Bacilli bacterium]